jgi:prevent-host-death family protein
MKTIEIDTSNQPIHDYINKVNKQHPLIFSNHGKPLFALVAIDAIDDFDLEIFSLSHNPEFMAFMEETRLEATDKKNWLTSDQIRQELGISKSLKKTAKR